MRNRDYNRDYHRQGWERERGSDPRWERERGYSREHEPEHDTHRGPRYGADAYEGRWRSGEQRLWDEPGPEGGWHGDRGYGRHGYESRGSWEGRGWDYAPDERRGGYSYSAGMRRPEGQFSRQREYGRSTGYVDNDEMERDAYRGYAEEGDYRPREGTRSGLGGYGSYAWGGEAYGESRSAGYSPARAQPSWGPHEARAEERRPVEHPQEQRGLGARVSGMMSRMFRGKGPRGYSRSDERVREDVCDALTENDDVDATDVEVSVQAGEVTLTGTVQDRRQKRVAEDIVETCRGVKDVHNQLRIRQEQHAQASQPKPATPATGWNDRSNEANGRRA